MITEVDDPRLTSGIAAAKPDAPKKGSLFRTAARIASWGAIAFGAFWTGVAGLGLMSHGAPIGSVIAPPPAGNWANMSQAWPALLTGVASMGLGYVGLKATKAK